MAFSAAAAVLFLAFLLLPDTPVLASFGQTVVPGGVSDAPIPATVASADRASSENGAALPNNEALPRGAADSGAQASTDWNGASFPGESSGSGTSPCNYCPHFRQPQQSLPLRERRDPRLRRRMRKGLWTELPPRQPPQRKAS